MHVLDTVLYEKHTPPDQYLDNFLKEAPQLNYVEAKKSLLALAHTHYGVYNHFNKENSKNRPLSLMAKHEANEYRENSALKIHMQRFIKEGFSEHISLKEYMELTREELKWFSEILNKEDETNSAKQKELMNLIKK